MDNLTISQILVNAFSTSDAVGKGIVVILLLASAGLWSIFIEKGMTIYGKLKSCKEFLRRFDVERSPLALAVHLDDLNGPLKNVCQVAIQEIFNICEVGERRQMQFLRNAVLPRKLSTAELDKVKSTMNRQIDQETLLLEEKLGWLSVFVTACPFLGLFGTVWGVMATFMSIASQGHIEISAIAPGISGALLTTVAGLVVAIPAVVGNILINSAINTVTLQMDIFEENFLASLRLEESNGSNEDADGQGRKPGQADEY